MFRSPQEILDYVKRLFDDTKRISNRDIYNETLEQRYFHSNSYGKSMCEEIWHLKRMHFRYSISDRDLFNSSIREEFLIEQATRHILKWIAGEARENKYKITKISGRPQDIAFIYDFVQKYCDDHKMPYIKFFNGGECKFEADDGMEQIDYISRSIDRIIRIEYLEFSHKIEIGNDEFYSF